MSDQDLWDRYNRQSSSPWTSEWFTGDFSNITIGSCLAGLLTGAFIIFKTLEILGYPVWLWLHWAMAAISNTFSSTSSNGTASGDTQDSNMQNGSAKVFGSVFGLSNGLIGKGVRGVTGALSKSYTSDVPAGLGNWDNSCYQNSVIQGMASLPSLREYLHKTTAQYRSLDKETTNGALYDMINNLNNPEHRGQHFWIRGKLKSMNTWQQQDAQEYFSKLLDELDKEVQKATTQKRETSASWVLNVKRLAGLSSTAQKDDTEEEDEENEEGEPEDVKAEEEDSVPPKPPQVTPNPLDGLLAQRVGCINCGYTEGLSMIPFNCITVPLGSGRSHYYDVRECLDEYTKLEYIEGVECAKCTLLKVHDTLTKLAPVPDSPFAERLRAVQEALDEEDFEDKTLKACGIAKKNWSQTTKSRQAVISRAPKAVVLHVNRSIFDEMTGAQLKNSAPVQYPQVLDLGHWCLGSQLPESPTPSDVAEERWPKDPNVSMLGELAVDPETKTLSPFQYKLRAVVTHFGSHGNGHYVCFRQHTSYKNEVSTDGEIPIESSPDEQWWRFSDENVYRVSEDAALHQGGVFMLFYERIDVEVSSLPSHKEANSAPVSLPEESTGTSIALSNAEAIASSIETAAEVEEPEGISENHPLSPPASPNLTPSDSPTKLTKMDRCLEENNGARSAYLTPPPESVACDSELDADTPKTIDDGSTKVPSIRTPTDDEQTRVDMVTETREEVLSSVQTQSPSPQKMRTAGSTSNRTNDNRSSLPMVSV
ncbi:cysteine proteinase [Aaosphaeria arxii CBS 175.79]|uniref:ubiquitinyl hydrolase 1 n=1 Tax=Aaosphaeria arxii CBS 175.79 TaxID=1450172 RepID=A0A6A5XEH8_9PLEO|nr:cysteine proteinase [Aaosphaeria arxii CBS 175.79]KAF2011472.1 cysteine proteinase [Aaosphaeria arxii CBS 175.79]